MFADQYQAAITSTAFAILDRSVVELTGRDRAVVLHNFTTNEIKKLGPGQGCEAFLSNIKGRIIGQIIVAIAEQSIWVDSVPGASDFIAAHLDKFVISEDVQFHQRTSAWSDLYIMGPESVRWIATTLGLDCGDWPVGQHAPAVISGATCRVQRINLTRVPGFLIRVPVSARAEIIESLKESLPLVYDEVMNALRIEAGYPLFGVDIGEENLAQEANCTARAISFTKGCYLGQEPIARLDALGHVNRLIVSLRIPGAIPLPTDSVFATDGTVIGKLTSVAAHPRDGGAVALALLKAKHATCGSQVQIGAEKVAATVTT